MSISEKTEVRFGPNSLQPLSKVSIRSPFIEKVALVAFATFAIKTLYPVSAFVTSVSVISIAATAAMMPFCLGLIYGTFYCSIAHDLDRDRDRECASLAFITIS